VPFSNLVEEVLQEALEALGARTIPDVCMHKNLLKKIEFKKPKLIHGIFATLKEKTSLMILSRQRYEEYRSIADNVLHQTDLFVCVGTLIDLLRNPHDWEWVYHNLADESSRTVLLKILRFRLLAPLLGRVMAFDRVGFGMTFSEFQKLVNRFYQSTYRQNGLYKIRVRDYRIWSSSRVNLLNAWGLEQYKYNNIVSAERGDNVIDAGAFVGATSIFFAYIVKSKGKVFAFEPQQKPFELLVRNIKANKLEDVVLPVKLGLWSKTANLTLQGAGSGASLVDLPARHDYLEEINCITIDDFCKEMKKVGFIKMDIEGAELEALKGAEKTLRKFKPKLAVSVYHRPRDIVEIAMLVKKLVPHYELFLQHKLPGANETVLFAT
jgi:FkbM family methyltransferase